MVKGKARKLRLFEPLKPFDKDWEKLAHSGRYDLARLKLVMVLLLDPDVPLPPEYLDHPLHGRWDGHRECHIGGDWLLIYQLADVGTKSEKVIFCRTGTHSELFG
jgi:mRNA interferase YafQ